MAPSSVRRNTKAGRPKLSGIARLRAKVWYRAVKRCGNWSDYKLDMEFGQAEGPITKGGAGRNRVFGIIGRKGTMPSRGDHHLRKFDLIQRVENHLQFFGTRDIIESPFWELLEMPPRDLEATSAFVSKCIDLLGLTRISGKAAISWMWFSMHELRRDGRPSLKPTGAGPYEANLSDATDGLPSDLNLLALFGGLYREACLSFNLENADTLAALFRITLDQFCSEDWIASHGDYLNDVALNRILYGKSDYTPAETKFESDEDVPIGTESQGFIVARTNPKLSFFLEHEKEIALALKGWVLSNSDNHESLDKSS